MATQAPKARHLVISRGEVCELSALRRRNAFYLKVAAVIIGLAAIATIVIALAR